MPVISCKHYLAGATSEAYLPPSLAGFGLPTPEQLVGLAMSYQIAQKVHAASGPHNLPDLINERPRDVVDLILLEDLVKGAGKPSSTEIRSVIEDIFKTRGKEATTLNHPVRTWPTQTIAHPHWGADYHSAATSINVELSLEEAVEQVNSWLASLRIYGASHGDLRIFSEAMGNIYFQATPCLHARHAFETARLFPGPLAAFADVHRTPHVSHTLNQSAAGGAEHADVLPAHSRDKPARITKQVLFGITTPCCRHFGKQAFCHKKQRLELGA